MPTSEAISEELFWSKVYKTDYCWNWIGLKTHKGYGLFSVHSVMRRAHRISLTIAGIEIPEYLQVDHLCRNTSCVNPSHLELVTIVENIRRAKAARELDTHCKHGHEWTKDNTFRYGKNYRKCRACAAQRQRERYKLK